MSEQSTGHVISGRPYVVTSANGRLPSSLEDFMGGAVTEVAVHSGGEVFTICGTCGVDGESVILYEKRSDGTGVDVRTWVISGVDDGFEAVARSRY